MSVGGVWGAGQQMRERDSGGGGGGQQPPAAVPVTVVAAVTQPTMLEVCHGTVHRCI